MPVFSTFALGSGDPNLNKARLRGYGTFSQNGVVEIDNVDFGLRKAMLLDKPSSPNALRLTENAK